MWTTHPALIQGTPEWYDVRRGMVTASVVGQLITVRKLSAIDYDCPVCPALADNPCQSKTKPGVEIKTLHPERAEHARNQSSSTVIEPARNPESRSLTTLLVSERITGWTDPSYYGEDMWRGHDDEPRAREKYGEHYEPVTEAGFMVRDDWGVQIGYSPDGLVGDDGLIEIKSKRPRIHLVTILADNPPIDDMAQMQCGLLVTGRKWLDYIAYCGGMPLWKRRVYPDQRWFKAIIAAVQTFEENAAEMMRIYDEATTGLPMTERSALDTLELKLA